MYFRGAAAIEPANGMKLSRRWQVVKSASSFFSGSLVRCTLLYNSLGVRHLLLSPPSAGSTWRETQLF